MWLRLYTSVLDDPKVQRLPAEEFRGWINMLILAKEGDGLLPSIEDLAFRLRITEADATRLTETLVQRGLLDSDGKNITPHNWHNRQFQSDASTERVKRYRNVTRNVSETPPEQSRAETEQSRTETEAATTSRAKPRSVRRPVAPDDEFLDGLQKNPAYSTLDVRLCYHKMVSWCEVNGKQPSRRRFINWLNREDKPMTGTINGRTVKTHRETHNERAARETEELIRRSLAASVGDSGADPNDTGETWIAADFSRI